MQRLIIALASLAAMLGTARLGVWQLDRAATKQAYVAELTARQALRELNADELAREPAPAAAQHHRRLRLSGQWLPQATVLLDNRQMNNRPGFFVLTALQLPGGEAVLVQRGWLLRDPVDRTRATVPTPPAGMVEVVGRVAPAPSRLYEFAGSDAGPIRQNLDLSEYGREQRIRLLPLTVLQTVGEPGLLREWPVPAADVSKHHGYAFQWFALSALVALLYVWFQIIRPRRRNPA